jgi:hypothetical protein
VVPKGRSQGRRLRAATPATALAVGALVVVMLAGLCVAGPAEHLLGVYAGLVLLATQVLKFHNTVAVAASTLMAAALFNPVRHRVQRAVDRRFNRARYDADRTVAAFAARLQDAVDLGTVRADLLGVVQGALEPAHLSMWIRPVD